MKNSVLSEIYKPEIKFQRSSKIHQFIILLFLIFGTHLSIHCQSLCTQYGNLPVDETLSGNYMTLVSRTNKVLEINGIVRFFGGCNLTDCKIKATADSRIEIYNFASTCQGCPPPPLTVYRLTNCKLFTCAGIWDGIDAKEFTSLIVTSNSEFEFAKAAIKATSNVSLRVLDSKFYDNTIGIDILGKVRGIAIGNNLFTFRVSTPGTSWNNTGIRVTNNPVLFPIGLGSSGNNVFSNLHKGVHISGSSARITKSRFDNNVKGILAENNSNLILVGIGKESGILTFYNNVEDDVSCFNNVALNMSECKSYRDANAAFFPTYWFGVRCNQTSNVRINIANCQWVTNNLPPGIDGINSIPFPNSCIAILTAFNISGGISSCKMVENGSEAMTAIRLNFVRASGAYNLNINKINASNTKDYSTRIESCTNIGVNGFDKIERSGTSTPAIISSFSDKTIIELNEIDDAFDNTFKPIGIRILSASNNKVCSNILTKTHTGLEVTGNSDNLKVGDNKFFTNRFGFQYNIGAMTNLTNVHRLNVWFGSNFILMANHDGLTYVSNRYIVRQDNYNLSPGIYNPPNNMKNPSQNEWIVVEQEGCPRYCLDTCLPPPIDPRMDGFTPYGELTYRDGFSDGMKWDNDKAFYRFVIENPGISLPADLQNLFNSLALTNISAFLNTSDLIKSVDFPAVSLVNSLSNIDDQVALKYIVIHALDIILADDEEITGTESEYLNRLTLEAELLVLLTQRDHVLNDILSERSTKISAARSSNNALTANNQQQIEEKFLNEITLKLAEGSTPSQAEYNQALQWSQRCILDFGNNVIYAYSLLPASLNYDRLPLQFCSGQSLSRKEDNWHNASDSSILTEILEDDEIYSMVEVYSLDGRLIEKQQNCAIKMILFNKENLKGLYLYKLQKEDGSFIIRKILR